MFDLGFWELLIVGLIALLVVGPERLPRLMRGVGLWVGRARATVSSIRDEVEREVNAEGWRETQRSIRKDIADTEEEVRQATDIGSPPKLDVAPGKTTPKVDSDAEASDDAAEERETRTDTVDGETTATDAPDRDDTPEHAHDQEREKDRT